MRRFVTRTGAWLAVIVGTAAFAGCGDASDDGTAAIDGSAGDAGTFDDSATPHDAGADTATPLQDAGPPDPCGTALFCETFDGYGGVTTIADKQKFVYGRMKMYIDPNGTSVHWTFFGIDGPAATTVDGGAGRNASYIMSSLPKSGVNTYSFVYGLSGTPSNGFHDCSSQSATSMPSAWACVSFEMDSSARKLRMYKDGVTTPILSVDDHGKGCVAPTPAADPWYGPAVTDLFVGAYSFHAMDAPLDVWIDDLVVDTKPVVCP